MLAQETPLSFVRFARAANRAKRENASGFTFLDESSRRKATSVLIEKRESVRRPPRLHFRICLAQQRYLRGYRRDRHGLSKRRGVGKRLLRQSGSRFSPKSGSRNRNRRFWSFRGRFRKDLGGE